MGKINKANLKKAIYYLRRNGVSNTWYAVRERLEERKAAPYSFVPVSREEIVKQRSRSKAGRMRFSIVVPTYRTDETYLYEMIQSVADQTYPHWELILADATEDDSVKINVDKCLQDMDIPSTGKINYVKLKENAGIAANTNKALKYASEDYIGLLDHDDVLTPNALYEMAIAIEEGKKRGVELKLLYSDEDKCNGDRTHYYEPNFKEDFNLDLLLSNNYICHFLVMKRELIKELGFRSKYDGAQDYDLVLRAVQKIKDKKQIAHIPKVLYHWRCHTGSTAENPQSKQYAYDAGLRALQDYADAQGLEAKAVALKHLGFYTLQYQKEPFHTRRKLGAIGGRILGNKGIGGMRKTIGGRMSMNGKVFYEGLPAAYSGYLHRAVLTQQAEAVDIRCIRVRKECGDLFEQTVGVPYVEDKNGFFDCSALKKGTDYKEASLRFSKALRDAGYEILYYPPWTAVVKEKPFHE